VISFPNTLRGRPIEISKSQVDLISKHLGIDAEPTIRRLAESGALVEVDTSVRLVKLLVSVVSAPQCPEHLPSQHCWCEPELRIVDSEGAVGVWVHRRIQ